VPPLFSATVDSPIGRLRLEATDVALVRLWLPQPSGPTPRLSSPSTEILIQAATELEEYFAGSRQVFTTPLALSGSGFQTAVWLELAKIPYATTLTYAGLARKTGSGKAARPVGQAAGRNPLPLFIPCHRVVAAGGLGGYGGGLEAKRFLLDLESRVASQSNE
jgi:methylated-DNA-[protein]-cysteine S-methyltransferase